MPVPPVRDSTNGNIFTKPYITSPLFRKMICDAVEAHDNAIPGITRGWTGNPTPSATLEHVFMHVQVCLPRAHVFTLDGAYHSKAPITRYFKTNPFGYWSTETLPVLRNIKVFNMRGAGNFLRRDTNFTFLTQALPELQEWNCAYMRPEDDAYRVFTRMLPHLSPTIVHLNLKIQTLNNLRPAPEWGWIHPRPGHVCRAIAAVLSQLETFTLTGRMCACIFDHIENVTARPSKLKSIVLNVKACCHESVGDIDAPTTGTSGRSNPVFIEGFTALVVGSIDSLAVHERLEHIHIQYVDLSAPWPCMNPRFEYANGNCMGIWNEAILGALCRVRPGATLPSLEKGVRGSY